MIASAPTFGQATTTAPAVSGALEEIVVTATRREERLQDVPISVSAFSQEKIDAQGLKNIDDLTRLTPGVAFSRNGMGSSANYNDENSDIAVRGIDSQAGSATTGVYLDDTPIQSRHIGFGAVEVFPVLFDVDRVEALRGPQGTLFGAGAEGGAVRIISPAPDLNKFGAYIRSEYGTTEGGGPSYEGGVAVGGPIIDGVLGFRFSVYYREDGGWVDRVSYTRAANDLVTLPTFAGTTEKDANYQQTSSARLAIKWQPTENLSVTPSVYFQDLRIHDTAAYWEALSDPSAGIYRNGNALTNPDADPWYLAAVKVDWNLGWANLNSNTAYYSRDQHSTSDYSQYLRATWAYFGSLPSGYPQAGDQGYAPFEDRQDNFYQEIRLASADPAARLTWNSGLYIAHTNENIPENIIDPTLNQEVINYTTATYGTAFPVCPLPTYPCPGGLIYEGPIDRIIEKQVALFGEATFKFTEQLKATVGLRVSRIDIDGQVLDGGAFIPLPLTPLTYEEARSHETPVTPKAVLDYQPDRDNLFYASISKGYRSGGVNTPVGSLCNGSLNAIGLNQVPETYSSDSLWSYELGAKNTLLDHRLQINSSIFVVNWSNIIQNVYLPSCGEQYAGNLGKVRSEGGDIQLTFKPISSLTLDVTAAYTSAKYTQASCAGSSVLNGTECVIAGQAGQVGPVVSAGDRILGAPWSFLFSGEYAAPFQVLNGNIAYLRVDYQRTTAQTAQTPGLDYHNGLFDDTVPGLPATTNLQLRAGVRWSGWDVSLFGNNLTNEHPVLFSSRDIASNCNLGNPGTTPPSSPGPCGSPLIPTDGFNSDNLYFARGVRPRSYGITATYRY